MLNVDPVTIKCSNNNVRVLKLYVQNKLAAFCSHMQKPLSLTWPSVLSPKRQRCFWICKLSPYGWFLGGGGSWLLWCPLGLCLGILKNLKVPWTALLSQALTPNLCKGSAELRQKSIRIHTRVHHKCVSIRIYFSVSIFGVSILRIYPYLFWVSVSIFGHVSILCAYIFFRRIYFSRRVSIFLYGPRIYFFSRIYFSCPRCVSICLLLKHCKYAVKMTTKIDTVKIDTRR